MATRLVVLTAASALVLTAAPAPATAADGPPRGVSIWKTGANRWDYIQRKGNRLRVAWIGGQPSSYEYGYEQGRLRGDKARMRTDYGRQVTQYRRNASRLRWREKSAGSWGPWYTARRTTQRKAELQRLFAKAQWRRYS